MMRIGKIALFCKSRNLYFVNQYPKTVVQSDLDSKNTMKPYHSLIEILGTKMYYFFYAILLRRIPINFLMYQI